MEAVRHWWCRWQTRIAGIHSGACCLYSASVLTSTTHPSWALLANAIEERCHSASGWSPAGVVARWRYGDLSLDNRTPLGEESTGTPDNEPTADRIILYLPLIRSLFLAYCG